MWQGEDERDCKMKGESANCATRQRGQLTEWKERIQGNDLANPESKQLASFQRSVDVTGEQRGSDVEGWWGRCRVLIGDKLS